MFVSWYFEDSGWILIFLLQALFVIRGLPVSFINPGTHFKNCVLLRIKFNFAIMCILTTLGIISFSFLAASQIAYKAVVPATIFFATKVFTNQTIYKRIKYKDDGRDIVNFKDFVTIHVTFPLMNAWFTYQFVYVSFIAFASICPPPAESTDNISQFCELFYGG